MDMTFDLAQIPITKIALTRQGPPTTRTRSLVPANQAVTGEGGSGYSCGKFGKPPARGETGRFINDKPHAWCGSCGWTTSHSTKSHDDWNANKSTFVLHDQHPLTIANQGSGKNGAQLKSKSKSNKSESDADTSGGLSLAALGEHFAKMETSASDPTQANMAQLLKNLL
jgi:hypothetical protein